MTRYFCDRCGELDSFVSIVRSESVYIEQKQKDRLVWRVVFAISNHLHPNSNITLCSHCFHELVSEAFRIICEKRDSPNVH